MNWLHWILNFAALLLWIDWRTGRAANQPQPVISLASALRETTRYMNMDLVDYFVAKLDTLDYHSWREHERPAT